MTFTFICCNAAVHAVDRLLVFAALIAILLCCCVFLYSMYAFAQCINIISSDRKLVFALHLHPVLVCLDVVNGACYVVRVSVHV